MSDQKYTVEKERMRRKVIVLLLQSIACREAFLLR